MLYILNLISTVYQVYLNKMEILKKDQGKWHKNEASFWEQATAAAHHCFG